MKEFYINKTICFTNKKLIKKFKCDWFQIYPVDNYINSDLKTNHFPFILEYKITKDDIQIISHEDFLKEDENNEPIEGVDKEFWSKLNHEYNVMTYILRLLSVVTNHNFFIYNANDQGWFLNLDGKTNEEIHCKYGVKLYKDSNNQNLGYLSEFSENHYEEVDYIKHSDYYQVPDIDNEGNGELQMSEHSLFFFNSIKKLSELQKRYFDSAVVLINNGTKIRNEMKSLAFLAFISSIETMTSLEGKINKEEIEFECDSCKSIKSSNYTCGKCNAPIWGIGQQIKIYLKKYLSADDKFKTAINKLYNYRSKIAHAGSLLTGDINFEWNDPKKRGAHYEALIASMQYSKMSLVNYVLINNENCSKHW